MNCIGEARQRILKKPAARVTVRTEAAVSPFAVLRKKLVTGFAKISSRIMKQPVMVKPTILANSSAQHNGECATT